MGELTAPALGRELGLSARAAHYLLRWLAAEGTLARTDRTIRLAGGRPAVVYRFVGPPRQAIRTDATAPVGPKTINNSLSVLRVALEHALEDGLIARNPAATARGGRERLKLAEEHREVDFLRLREIPRYLDACDDYRPLGELLIATGLRISEALDLAWRDVDLDGRALLVTSSRKRQRSGGEGSGSTKGDRRRAVEFGPRLESILRDLRARAAEDGRAGLAAQPVFAGAAGGRLDRRKVSSGPHKRALRDAGLRETLRLHDLCHTARRLLARRRPAPDLRPTPARPRIDHHHGAPVRAPREELPARRGRARRGRRLAGPCGGARDLRRLASPTSIEALARV